jgi:hypothetical protein
MAKEDAGGEKTMKAQNGSLVVVGGLVCYGADQR